MIKLNELRVGNWVWNEDSYFKIEQAAIIDAIARIPHVHPIPLTHDILLKSGFLFAAESSESYYAVPDSWYTEEDGYLPPKDDFVICQRKDGQYIIMNGCGFTEYRIGRNIESLHQLQNVYYALTGEELTIEL